MSNTLKFGNGNFATKDGSVLAYNDENNNYKPLPFDFSRGSTATRVNKEGLIETVGTNEPRIDFKDDVKGALLLEPTRTNYIPYSTLDFNGGSSPIGWSIGFGTGTYSYEQLEYKGQKAVKQTQITTGRSYLDTGLISILANTEHTLKIQFILDECVADANDIIVNFLGFGIDEYYSFSDIDANGVLELQYNPLSDNVGNLRIGLGCSENEDGGKSLAWAIPQLEQGSYATSYIPTSGSAVTRVIEVCNNGGNDQVINSTEGVLYVEIKRPINQLETSQYLGVSDGGTDNRFIIGASATSSNLRFIGDMNGVRVLDVTRAGFNKEDWLKIAIVWDLSEFKIFINGTKNYETTLSDNFTANTLNTFEFANGSMSSVFYGISKDVKIYNTALTDAELISLTS